ncbi:hypothetical protein Pst134EA_011366 [Puccinia striiformis f. sp. tritici]|nr:hypothetical protein Pst134EA_011366 [Puccinia striiformis f. sp. tritici]KAH9467735.1 hypothetical protein Pst134EA_011366 [Puccinia striiformis f. sp. tritici]KAI9604961.1 hypothetical protein H4Q26_002931 [Puccinia striiformis f. sp. tritici PST-130]
MLSLNFFCNALRMISVMGPLANAGYVPSYQEPVHFTRSSSLSQSSTSSRTTSTRSFQSSVTSQPAVVIRSFQLSQDGVNCQYRSSAPGQAPQGGIQSTSSSINSSATGSSSAPRMVANLTPYKCHAQCKPATPSSPHKRDCQKIIHTMRSMKHRSLTIEPQNWLYVSYKTCAVVFENSNSQNVAVKYQWNRLADQAHRLQAQCAVGASSTTSGTCFFSSCDVDDSTQHSKSTGQQTNGNNSLSSVENSGIMISFQRTRS